MNNGFMLVISLDITNDVLFLFWVSYLEWIISLHIIIRWLMTQDGFEEEEESINSIYLKLWILI